MSEPKTAGAQERSNGAGVPGRRRILVVDDEETVLDLLSTVLIRCGHDVVQASTAEQGISLAREFASCLDLVITDITMPGMSGVEMVREIHDTHPDVPVLYLSGDPDDAIVRWGVSETCLLGKPFPLNAFRSRIADILDV